MKFWDKVATVWHNCVVYTSNNKIMWNKKTLYIKKTTLLITQNNKIIWKKKTMFITKNTLLITQNKKIMWNKKTACIKKFCLFLVSSFLSFGPWDYFFHIIIPFQLCQLSVWSHFFLPNLCWVYQPEVANLCRPKNTSCFKCVFSVSRCRAGEPANF